MGFKCKVEGCNGELGVDRTRTFRAPNSQGAPNAYTGLRRKRSCNKCGAPNGTFIEIPNEVYVRLMRTAVVAELNNLDEASFEHYDEHGRLVFGNANSAPKLSDEELAECNRNPFEGYDPVTPEVTSDHPDDCTCVVCAVPSDASSYEDDELARVNDILAGIGE